MRYVAVAAVVVVVVAVDVDVANGLVCSTTAVVSAISLEACESDVRRQPVRACSCFLSEACPSEWRGGEVGRGTAMSLFLLPVPRVLCSTSLSSSTDIVGSAVRKRRPALLEAFVAGERLPADVADARLPRRGEYREGDDGGGGSNLLFLEDAVVSDEIDLGDASAEYPGAADLSLEGDWCDFLGDDDDDAAVFGRSDDSVAVGDGAAVGDGWY
jgi:hypothetical protein